MATTIHILASPTANLASVAAAVRRCDGEPALTDSPQVAVSAERLIVPGVGSFAAAMSWLNSSGLAGPLLDRVGRGAPTLGICLGMQVLFESSEESPGAAGLGVIGGRITRFREAADCRVPQLGWNRVTAPREFSAAVGETGFAYFANSYRASVVASGEWVCATSDHGGPFVAAVQHVRHKGVMACQFHPELSGPGVWGLGLLRRWMNVAAGAMREREGDGAC